MIGKCITCKSEIEIIGGRRYCEQCRKVKNSANWKIFNEQRSGISKTQYNCAICDGLFYARAKRKYDICHKVKCQNYFYSLGRKIKVLQERIEKAQHKLVASEIRFQTIVERSQRN